MSRLVWCVVAGAVLLGAYTEDSLDVVPVRVVAAEVSESLGERMDAIDASVNKWRSAESLKDAQRAAEGAANLVAGPRGPGYGDRDGDGVV